MWDDSHHLTLVLDDILGEMFLVDNMPFHESTFSFIHLVNIYLCNTQYKSTYSEISQFSRIFPPLNFHSNHILNLSVLTFFMWFCKMCVGMPPSLNLMSFTLVVKVASRVYMCPVGTVWGNDMWKLSHLLAVTGNFVLICNYVTFPTYQSKNGRKKLKGNGCIESYFEINLSQENFGHSEYCLTHLFTLFAKSFILWYFYTGVKWSMVILTLHLFPLIGWFH